MDDEKVTYEQEAAPAQEEPKVFEELNLDKAFDACKLAEVVRYWLNYQQSVSRSKNLLHEASFRYPIVEFLERYMKTAVILELQHPTFKKPMDFQWKIEEKRYYLECKYVKKDYTETKQEMQRYFDDICRLYYCIKDEQKDECYFLVCGRKEDFDLCFTQNDMDKEKDPINKQRYNLFLPFMQNTTKVISPRNEREEGIKVSINNCYADFFDNYSKDEKGQNKLEQQIDITIQLINVWNENEQSVGLWQIKKGKLAQIQGQILN